MPQRYALCADTEAQIRRGGTKAQQCCSTVAMSTFDPFLTLARAHCASKNIW